MAHPAGGKSTVGILLLIFKIQCQPGASSHRSGADVKNTFIKSLQEFVVLLCAAAMKMKGPNPTEA